MKVKSVGFSKFVRSGFIKSLSYDGKRLRVEMRNGSEYHYPGVTPSIAREVINAHSHGEAYNRLVKGRYIVAKVRGANGTIKV